MIASHEGLDCLPALSWAADPYFGIVLGINTHRPLPHYLPLLSSRCGAEPQIAQLVHKVVSNSVLIALIG